MKTGIAILERVNGARLILDSRADISTQRVQDFLKDAKKEKAPLIDITCGRPGRRVLLHAVELPSGHYTARCNSMQEHLRSCPCPHLDLPYGPKPDTLYSANMFSDAIVDANGIHAEGHGLEAGEARRGFGSFCEALLSRAYYHAFWGDDESICVKPNFRGPDLAGIFRAARGELEKALFSFELCFSDVVARAGREFMVLLIDAPLDKICRQLVSGKRFAFRTDPRWVVAASKMGQTMEWAISGPALQAAHGRAKNRRGFCRPPYFAVLVGSRRGGQIECEHCYFHPVMINNSFLATVASHEERQWLATGSLSPDETLYKPVARMDFNDTMARLLANFGYRWEYCDLVPDRLVVSKTGLRVGEYAGLKDDPKYLADFSRKTGGWAAIARAIPVITCDGELASSLK